jgi:hypothetical protein
MFNNSGSCLRNITTTLREDQINFIHFICMLCTRHTFIIYNSN